MKVTVLKEPNIETEIIIRCSDVDSKDVQAVLQLISENGSKIPTRNEDELIFLSSSQVLYGEFVNRKVFLYTNENVFPTGLTLANLEEDYKDFFRCSKSMVVNLRQIKKLKSEMGGRIIATLSNEEQILISRHYASGLRQRLLKSSK